MNREGSDGAPVDRRRVVPTLTITELCKERSCAHISPEMAENGLGQKSESRLAGSDGIYTL